ncbi:phosphoglycerate mutase family protein [Deinococcus taeanensis]|uniref:histidine phosphatase family protein n=1 Tax=Deinococcus taeanensis TaxID=2737050 RepID=UPI001CDCC7BA|nr:histidine phosphatase family protein [Deinococcus taeanensis]UBV41828.1 phosphoglycerate mutase family protein [Deinococcus taeanensis]
MTRTLHLIKHARPECQPGVPAHEWTLAAGALNDLPAVAAGLHPRPQIVVCSTEPKAHATAQGLATLLGVALRPMQGLHEQLRYTAPWRPDPAGFNEDDRRFFLYPDRVVTGEESARDALSRFTTAVNAVMDVNTQGSVALVAHGTVISLLVGALRGVDPSPLWRDLPLLGVQSVAWEPPGTGARTAP